MPSFEQALALGADALEFDVALTRDEVPVVLHDDTLERTTTGRGPVEEALARDVLALDAGVWMGLPTRLPSLADVLGAFATRTTLNLEIKESPRRATLVDACVREVVAHEATSRVVFSSFDHDALRLVRHLLPAARIGVLCEPATLVKAFVCARETGAENLHPPVVLVNASLVDKAHAEGLRVWTWTANEPPTIERMIAAGVDGIFSDWPERVVALRDALRPF